MKYSITHSRLIRKIRRKKEQLSHLLHSTRYRFQKIKSLQNELNQLTRQGQKKLKYTLGILSISAFMGQYSFAQNIEKTMFHKPVPFHEWQGFQAIAIGSSTFLKPDLVDIDGDGDFDLFLGNHKGLLFYENKGDRSNPIFTKEDAQWEPFNFQKPFDNPALETSFVDLDDDGDYDLLCSVYEYGDVYYYENVGDKENPDFKTPVKSPFGFENPANNPFEYSTNSTDIIDLDNDGDYDIVSVDYYGDFFFYENVGDKKNPSFLEPVKNDLGLQVGDHLNSNWEGNIVFNDIDRDGDLDIFVGTWSKNTVFYENQGSSCNPTFGAEIIDPFQLSYEKDIRREALTFADLDGDGQDELLLAGTGDFELYYYDIDQLTPSLDGLVGCAIDTLIQISTCNSFDFNGKNYSKSGNYIDTLVSLSGEDSIVGLELHIGSITADVKEFDDYLMAEQENATYQWYRSLHNGQIKLDGETKQYFIPEVPGDYFVSITNENCEQTSDTKQIEQSLLKVESFPQRYSGKTNGFGHFDQKHPIRSSNYMSKNYSSKTRFSYDIVADEQLMIVSEPLDDFDSLSVNYVQVGSISTYIKKEDQWVFQEKIYAPHYKDDVNQFGRAIAMSDEYVIVGAPSVYFPSNSEYFAHRGAVFIYKRNNDNTLTFHQSIICPTNQKYSSYFGRTVQVDGDVSVIGGEKYTYIYRYNIATTLWELEKTLELNTRTTEIGISEDQITLVSNDVLVYHYSNGVWSEVQKIIPPSGKIYRAEIDNNQMILSLNSLTNEKGEVSLYHLKENHQWEKEWEFVLPEEDSPQNNYGYYVQIKGDYALISSKTEDHYLMNGKKAHFPDVHLFHKSNSTWKYHQALVYEHDSTASPVARIELTENEILIGAYNKDIINRFTLDQVQSWEYRNLDCGATYFADSLITYAPQDIYEESYHLGIMGLPQNIYHERVEAIDEYLFDDNIKLTETGHYMFTLENTLGCDSIVSLDLMIYKEEPSGQNCANAVAVQEGNYYKVSVDDEYSYYTYTAQESGILKVSTCDLSEEEVIIEFYDNCDLIIEKSIDKCGDGGTYIESTLSKGDQVLFRMNNEDVGEDFFFEVTFTERCFVKSNRINTMQSADCNTPIDIVDGFFKVNTETGSSWYRYEASEKGELSLSTVNLTYEDTKIEIYTDCNTMLTSNDDFSHLQSQIVYNMEEGESILIHMSDQYIRKDYIFSLVFAPTECDEAVVLNPETELQMTNIVELVKLEADKDGDMMISTSQMGADFIIYDDNCRSSIVATTCNADEKIVNLQVNKGDVFFFERNNEIDFNLKYEVVTNTKSCSPIVENMYISSCDYYVYQGDTIAATGDYQYITQSTEGYDSLITIVNFSIKEDCAEKCEIYKYESQTTCSSFEWRNQVIEHSGVYFDTTFNECNTIYQLNAVITSSIQMDTIKLEECEPFQLGNLSITTSGIFSDTLYYESGCDSVIHTYNITILDSLECNDTVAAAENISEVHINVFPIPTKEKVNIQLPKTVNKLVINVYTIDGQSRSNAIFYNTNKGFIKIPGERGIYLLYLYCDNQKYPIVQKVIKN
ncbi:T9SS type A sorting domain-containing protein [Flammeovirga agarivorans]|uniref:T9SS type A sorting domain-containing protein n=1 Tax=Flammeovirga agarivorans TaxID=2726742 RepID=A0A7X8SL10_9BACT|nr:T9SS type A sorting domain-containing protein [Flammeovirga agarivorans]NLR92067.1 T9SS type A sorting domain-containing protein [Flammeovirga agarivorans]